MSYLRAIHKILNSGGISLFIVVLAISTAGNAMSATQEKGSDYLINQVEFRNAKMSDAVRLLSELSGINIVVSETAAKEEVTLFLRDMTVESAIDTLCKVTGLWYREDSQTGVYRIMEAKEYQKDIVVFKNDVLKVFTLRHYNVVSAAYAIQNLFGNRVRLQLDRQPDETGLGGGGGMMGMGGGFQNNTGQNFSQANQNNFQNGGQFQNNMMGQGFGMGMGMGGNGLGQKSVLEGIELTAEQLSIIRGSESQEGLPMISKTELVEITDREPMIQVTTSRLHNLVMVRTSDTAAIDEIGALLDEIDRAAPQVLLEMKVLDLKLGDEFRSVFDIDYVSPTTISNLADGQPGNPLVPTSADNPPNLVGGLGNFPIESSTLLFQWMNDSIRVRLQLLEQDNRVSTLASPVLLASNNTPARLFIGEEVVLTTGVSTTTQTGGIGQVVNLITPQTEVVDIGNTLEILPRVNSDGSVTLTVSTDISSLKPNGSKIPVTGADGTVTEFPVDAVNDSSLEGTFLAQDGLTVAIGGLISRRESNVEQKVPVLGDIPWLGFFFKKQERTEDVSELVILITPKVFITGEDAENRSLETMNRISTESVKGRFGSDTERIILDDLEGVRFEEADPVKALEDF